MRPHPGSRVDVLHVCYGGLSGQMDVVNVLNAEFQQRGLRTGVVAIAPPTQLVDRSSWQSVDLLDVVTIRRRGDVASLFETARIVAKRDPRALLLHSHRHGLAAQIASRLSGRRGLQLTVEATSLPLRTPLHNILSLMSLALSDGVTVLSEDYRSHFPLLGSHLPGTRHVFVTPNGVNSDVYRPASRGAPGPDQHVFTIGMAGRLVEGKDFDSLIRALAAGPLRDTGTRLRIAGSGIRLSLLESLARSLQVSDRVEFLGNIPPSEMPADYRGLDAYVHATDGEAMSTAILQASATGIPVVASDVAGIRELPSIGLSIALVPARDVDALAMEIDRIRRASPRARHDSGAALRSAVEARFSARVQAQRYLEAFAALDPAGAWGDRF